MKNLVQRHYENIWRYKELDDGSLSITGCNDYRDSFDELPTQALNKKVTWISDGAFKEKRNLKDLIVPEGFLGIGDDAFAYSDIDNISLPESLKEIGNSAFWFCDKLKEIHIPAGVTKIGWDVFGFCTSLTRISVAKDNESYLDIDGVLFSADKKELVAYPIGRKEKEYRVPKEVKRILWEAFLGCTELEVVKLPEGFESIEKGAFAACESLKTLHIPASVGDISPLIFGEFYYDACSESLTIVAAAGSYAHEFAIKNSIAWSDSE